ncbi:MAG: hypothetical protein AABX51_08225 [Nanoarchaeota archaeon]
MEQATKHGFNLAGWLKKLTYNRGIGAKIVQPDWAFSLDDKIALYIDGSTAHHGRFDEYKVTAIDETNKGPNNNVNYYFEKSSVPQKPLDWLDDVGKNLAEAGYKNVQIYYNSQFIGIYGQDDEK